MATQQDVLLRAKRVSRRASANEAYTNLREFNSDFTFLGLACHRVCGAGILARRAIEQPKRNAFATGRCWILRSAFQEQFNA